MTTKASSEVRYSQGWGEAQKGLGSTVGVALIIWAAVFACGGVIATEGEDKASKGEGVIGHVQAVKTESSLSRYRVFALKNISAEQAKAYIGQLLSVTVSKLPSANMILVTAGQRELLVVSSIISVVDSNQPYVVKTLAAASSAQDFPTNEKIGEELNDLVIGTFLETPTGHGKSKVIIDTYKDSIIALAPAGAVDRIVSAVEKIRKSGAGKNVAVDKATSVEGTAVEPNEAVVSVEPVPTPIAETNAPKETAAVPDSNSNGSSTLFNRLLESLAKAQKKAGDADASKQPKEVNEPGTLEKIDVNIVPVKPVRKPGASRVEVKSKQDTDLALILQKLNALEAAMKTKQGEAESTAVPEEKPEEANEAMPEEKPEEANEAMPEEKPEEANEAMPEEKPEDANEVMPEEKPAEANEAVPTEATSYGNIDIPHANDVLQLDLPDKIKFEVFLGLVGEHLGFDFLYNPADVQGDITFLIGGKRRGAMTVGELYRLLENVLQFNSYVMTRRGNLVIIRKADKAESIAMLDPKETDGETKLQTGDVVVKRFFHLEYVDTKVAKTLLRGMMLGSIGNTDNIMEIPETKMLIVTEYAYRMDRVRELLDVIDKPGEPKKFRSRKLRYTEASALATKVQALVQQLGEISITVAQPTTAATAQVPPRAVRRQFPPPPTAAPGTQPGAAPVTPAATAAPSKAESGVYLDFDERTNRILMIGFDNELNVVEQLIDSLDVEKQDLRAIRVIEIQHVDAEEVRNKLQELGIISGGGTTTATGRITGGPRRERDMTRGGRGTMPPPAAGGAPGTSAAPATTTGTSALSEEPLVQEPQVIIIGATNSLLINATEEQHTQIAMIIGYVDSEAEATSIPYVVYQLQNQDPEKLAGVLKQLIQETTSTQQDKEGKIISKQVEKRTEEDIIIIPDPATYSLIVYASKKNQTWIASLVKQLDEYRPQVLMDVTLVEIKNKDSFEYDLDLLTKYPSIPAVGTGVILPIGGIVDKRSWEARSTGDNQGFYSDQHIQALLTIMQKKEYGRVLAKPKLLVNDNQEGTIKTEDTEYVAQTQTNILPSGGVGQPTQQSSVNFQSYKAGIELTIQPHISKGNQLQLQITLNRTDFGEKTTPVKIGNDEIPVPRPTNTNNVKTVVTVPDGTTIILGGLEKISQGKSGNKIPIIGDLPIVGFLFRSVSNTDDQRRLYVFVKAHILRPGEKGEAVSDIEVVSKKNRDRFEQYEAEMQNYQDVPGIKAKPMSPTKVLEGD
jgi:general secretion pathway protein D